MADCTEWHEFATTALRATLLARLSDGRHPLADELLAEVERFVAHDLHVDADGYMSSRGVYWGHARSVADTFVMASPYRMMLGFCESDVVDVAWNALTASSAPSASSASSASTRAAQLAAALGPRISPTSTGSRLAFVRFVRGDAGLAEAVAAIRSAEFAQHFRGCCVQ